MTETSDKVGASTISASGGAQRILLWVLAIGGLVAMVFLGYGPSQRGELDLESDVSVMQVLRGGWKAMFFLDRSPLPQYPMPYGGWPPLQLMVQSMLALAGVPVAWARLAADTVIIGAFGWVVVMLCRKWKLNVPGPVAFGIATLGPGVAMFCGVGVSHITIPLALTLPWLGAEWVAEKERTFWQRWLCIIACGVVVGLTDWHAVSIGFVAAWYLVLLWRHDPRKELMERLKVFFAIAVVVAATFAAFLAAKHVLLAGELLVENGATGDKFLKRITPTLFTTVMTVVMTCVRVAITTVPLWFAARLAYRAGARAEGFPATAVRLMWVSTLGFTVCFIGLTWIPAHHFEMLIFVPVSVFTILLRMGEPRVARVSPFASVAMLMALSFTLLLGYKVVWLRASRGNPMPAAIETSSEKTLFDETQASFSSIGNIGPALRRLASEFMSKPLSADTGPGTAEYWFAENASRLRNPEVPARPIFVSWKGFQITSRAITQELVCTVKTSKDLSLYVEIMHCTHYAVICPVRSSPPDIGDRQLNVTTLSDEYLLYEYERVEKGSK